MPAGTGLSLQYSDSDISSVSLSEDGQQIHLVASTDARISTGPWASYAYLLLTYLDGSQDSLVAPYRVVAPPVPEATPEPSSELVAPAPEETSAVAVPTASAEPTATPVATDAAAALPKVTESVVAPVAPTAVAASPTYVPFVEPTLLAASQLSVGPLPTRGLPLLGPRVEHANAASQTAQLSEASSSQAAASSSSSAQQSAQPVLARTGAGDSLTILSMVGASLFFVGGAALVAVRRQAKSK
ncbi:hypothetical protein E4U03_02730 [Rothia nasimurium]|uniref:Gram-positive cocci surface proteins LPxTG domain-containing protein n=1 Tax=Rothia nasimurium TaxID=85336 RepID=A0A4Y9F877_9MICC|nr:hypothetical protein [Rothia nasimurium]MBF0807533.1 hypothetical protein [Rothia nasimurium]TFU23634.1 hypothetical protein E4U03_02730 [Rothia nasimurium]